MVAPNIMAETWWTEVSPSDLSVVMQTIIVDPISAEMSGLSEGDKGLGAISRDDFPADLGTVLDGAASSQLHRAYLATFHAWLLTHPDPMDSGKIGVLRFWPVITGDSQATGEARKAELKIRARLITKLADRFQQYRQAMFTACSQVRVVLDDQKVTGNLKKGRLILDHAADPRTKRVKSHGRTMYRTPEGYLARKVGFVGQGARARDDWNITVSRAVLHQQTKLVTDTMVSHLSQGTDAASMFDLVTDVRMTAVDLLSRCWGTEFRTGLNSTIEGWSQISGPPASNFAEIPAYAVERLSGTKNILQGREAELRAFNTEYLEFRSKWSGPSADQALLADDLKSLLNAAVLALQNFWNAFRDLIDCQVEVAQRFYEWLIDWTEKQQKKGFRTLHPELWVALKLTKITLMTAGLVASIALTVLSFGTVAPFVALGVAGASILLDKFEDYVVEWASAKDLKDLDEDELAEKYLGKGYVTAQEKALGGALHLYQDATSGKLSKQERQVRVEGALERLDQGVEVIEFFDENRERLETGVKVLSAIGQLAAQAKDAEQAALVKEGMEQLLHVVGPISIAGSTAEVATAGAVGGVKLGIEVIADVITYFVPPELKDLVKPDMKVRLDNALDMAKSKLQAQEEEALKGELRADAELYALFTFDGSSVRAEIVDANNRKYEVTVSDLTLRPRYQSADVFRRVLDTYQDKSSSWAGTYEVDDKYVLMTLKGAGEIPSLQDYDPENLDEPAIVRFRKANLFADFEEAGGAFICEDVDGTLLKRGGRAWESKPGAYTVTILAEGEAYYEGPSAGTRISKQKSQQLDKAKKLQAAVRRKKDKELVST